MEAVLNTEKIIMADKDYWINNDLDSIPDYLSKRFGNLANSVFHEYEVENIFEPPLQFLESLEKTDYVMEHMPYLVPHYLPHCLDLLEKGIKLTLLFPLSIFEIIKAEYIADLKQLLDSKNTEIFVYHEKTERPMVNVMTNYVILGFFNKYGIYGTKELMSNDENAIKWGKDLFSHYMKSAKKVNEI